MMVESTVVIPVSPPPTPVNESVGLISYQGPFVFPRYSAEMGEVLANNSRAFFNHLQILLALLLTILILHIADYTAN